MTILFGHDVDTMTGSEAGTLPADAAPTNEGVAEVSGDNKGDGEISLLASPPVDKKKRKHKFKSQWRKAKRHDPEAFKRLQETTRISNKKWRQSERGIAWRKARLQRPDVKASLAAYQKTNNQTAHRKAWMAEYMRGYRAQQKQKRLLDADNGDCG